MNSNKTKSFNYTEKMKKWKSVIDYLNKLVDYSQIKNSKMSENLRKKANLLYIQNNHDEEIHKKILSLYTQSIAVAIENSEEQALAYNNRSALLMHLLKYDECLIDIDKAFNITKSNDLKKKLKIRQEKCLALLMSKNFNTDAEDSNPSHSIIPQFVSEKISMAVQVTVEQQFKGFEYNYKKLKPAILESPSKMIPNFSDSLNLTSNKNYERQVVASRDIEPGEILSIEGSFKCFATSNIIYSSCSYCLSFMWNGIPCPNCIFAVYCSEKCKLKSWQEYHDVECNILLLLFDEFLNLNNLSISALRLFITCVKAEGLQNVIEDAKYINTDKNAKITGFLTNGKFDPSKFKAFYNLFSHAKDTYKEINDDFGSIGVVVLSQYTKILNKFKGSKGTDDLVFIKNILIKLKTIIEYNSFSFQSEAVYLESMGDSSKFSKSLGNIVSPCSSLFNHSCFANTFPIYCENGNKMIISCVPIKKNEEIFYSYGPDLSVSRKDRQIFLESIFHFTCKCEPCRKNWHVDEFEELVHSHKDIYFKVLTEFEKYKAKMKFKKMSKPLPVVYSIKYLQLAHKFLEKKIASILFYHHIEYLELAFHKMYGFDFNVPNSCQS